MARTGRSMAAPYPLWTPQLPSFHPAISLYTIKPWICHSCGAKIRHLPHNDLVICLGDPRPIHTMEIQSRFTQWRSKAASHNGDPEPLHTMDIQAGSHNGDPSWFTRWRSKAASHNGDPEPLHTMDFQAGSHNGDPRLVHTMEIQAGSHNGDPKPAHIMEIQSRFTQWKAKAGSRNAACSGPWHSSGYARRKWFASLIPTGNTVRQGAGGSGKSAGTRDCSVIGVVVVAGIVGVDCKSGFPLGCFAGKKVNNVCSRGRGV